MLNLWDLKVPWNVWYKIHRRVIYNGDYRYNCYDATSLEHTRVKSLFSFLFFFFSIFAGPSRDTRPTLILQSILRHKFQKFRHVLRSCSGNACSGVLQEWKKTFLPRAPVVMMQSKHESRSLGNIIDKTVIDDALTCVLERHYCGNNEERTHVCI